MKNSIKIILSIGAFLGGLSSVQAGGTHIPDGTSHPICQFLDDSHVFLFARHNVLQQVQLVKIPRTGKDGQFLVNLVARGILDENVLSDQLIVSWSNSSSNTVTWTQPDSTGTKIKGEIVSNDLVRLTFSHITYAKNKCVKEKMVEFMPGHIIPTCVEFVQIEAEKTLDQEVVDIPLNNCRLN